MGQLEMVGLSLEVQIVYFVVLGRDGFDATLLLGDLFGQEMKAVEGACDRSQHLVAQVVV